LSFCSASASQKLAADHTVAGQKELERTLQGCRAKKIAAHEGCGQMGVSSSVVYPFNPLQSFSIYHLTNGLCRRLAAWFL
jgi:hypothetical protein